MNQTPASGMLPPLLVERLTQCTVLEQFLTKLEASLAPTDRTGLHRRSSLLRGLGRMAEAASAYQDILALDPRDRVAKTGAAILAGEPLPAQAAGPAPFVRIENALSPEQQGRLWHALEGRTSSLRPADVYGGGYVPEVDGETRIAARLDQADEVRRWFLPWVEDLMARSKVLPRLGLSDFAVGRRELQVTGHGDGGFFNIHSDASADPDSPVWARHVTFVYYFHRQPRGFSGGDLLLFDPPGGGDLGFTRFDPAHNSLVFFQSNQMHMVTHVHCASTDPLDGRWTVNGWLHHLDAPGSSQSS